MKQQEEKGGRLYYLKDNQRVYFLEDLYGPRGNLMPRDIVTKHIYDAPSQVYLDISFLGKDKINKKLSEVSEVCKMYANLDVTKESIPVYPSVHFFMGGFKVNNKHQTNITNLYAIGECASEYHGANRLGGNSLLAAIRSANVAAASIEQDNELKDIPNFDEYINIEKDKFINKRESKSPFSAMYIRFEITKIMDECLGITRNEAKLKKGIEDINYFLSVSNHISFDSDVSVYVSYSIKSLLILAKAILVSVLERKETRGAHIREDYPNKEGSYEGASYISYNNGSYQIKYKKE